MAGKPAAAALSPGPEADRRTNLENTRDRNSDPVAVLRQARSQLELVCQMLLWPSPEVLEGCESLLTKTAADLQTNSPVWRAAAGNKTVADEGRLTRKTLQRARRLLDNAARFHSRWQRIRAVMSSGYQADGAPGEPQRPGRILAQG